MAASFIHLDDHIANVTRRYENPLSVIRADSFDAVAPAIEAIRNALAQGYYVCGYGAYELGYALDPPLRSHLQPHHTPLLEFGVFEGFSHAPLTPSRNAARLPLLRPDWSATDYESRFDRLITYIEAGDLYQANLTYPYRGHSETAPDLPALYTQLRGRQPVRYGAMISLGETQILSLSPELFFALKDGVVSARPMKGTAPRHADPQKDTAIASAMQADEKSQAENLMIVDLLRNDLSRVSKSGSVTVTDLFSLESFPTLHQMTSGIEASLREDLDAVDAFQALFPCGSVTGAPKIRAMEVIAELESRPRGPYCGAIGYFDPNGDASFNVAIRTLTSAPAPDGGFDLTYNVGSGVVHDSVGLSEYEECRLKARIVTDAGPDLVETLLWSPDAGFAYLEGHMIRLMQAAAELSYPLDMARVMAALDAAANGKRTAQRVRLTLSPRGAINVTLRAADKIRGPVRLRISEQTVEAGLTALRYKLSPMPVYDAARGRLAALTDCDEWLFINERGELTEGSYTTLFVEIDGQLYTPPLRCGLLPGVLRQSLIDTGEAIERVINPCDLSGARALYVGNSVRGLMPAILVDPVPI